ncbi:hypothetical protein GF327_04860 [Candidatus Woesearchaeota archaeon]|nr:hypothetical protein [Candidatus Woesearchaeota archaeon]
MATKSITITEEAYERLASFKGPKDSFSDVINKLTRKYSLFDIVGILSEDEAEDLENAVKEIRKDMDKRVKRIANEIK